MGIGLSTVSRILRDHDGIAIPHSTPGRGTSFDLFFPLIAWRVDQPESPPVSTGVVDYSVNSNTAAPVSLMSAAAPLADENQPTGTSEATILLVDDQEMVAQVTARGLQRLGFRVITHTDGRRALDDFMQTPEIFDVVITDQIMPHISGVRLTRKIRDIRPDIPVILITGFRDSFNEQQAKEAGVTDFVLKPTSHRDLAELVRRVKLRGLQGEG